MIHHVEESTILKNNKPGSDQKEVGPKSRDVLACFAEPSQIDLIVGQLSPGYAKATQVKKSSEVHEIGVAYREHRD